MNETGAPLDPVEDALARCSHLDDGGFTDRAMAALPPRHPWRRALPLALGGLAAAALAAWVLPDALGVAAEALRGWRQAEVLFPTGALGAAAALAAVAYAWVSVALQE